jgi:quinol monooxygenase YgiN
VSLFVYEGRFRARGDRREELVSALLRAAEMMQSEPDCLQYVVGHPLNDPSEVRVFEVWTSKEAHDESLSHPAVRKLIGEVLPILEGKPSGESWIGRGGKGIGP